MKPQKPIKCPQCAWTLNIWLERSARAYMTACGLCGLKTPLAQIARLTKLNKIKTKQ